MMERNRLVFQAFNENDQIDRVFQCSYDFLDVTYKHLLIVLPNKCTQPAKTKEWACKQLTSLKNVTVAFISFPELKSALLNGHLFYTMLCTDASRVCCNPKEALPAIDGDLLATLRLDATIYFLGARKKAMDFMAGALFYSDRKNFALAAFMLHQALELQLRGALYAFFKKRLPTHSIRELLVAFISFFPALDQLFPQHKDADIRLLKLLDDAYVHVRYRDDFEIQQYELHMLVQRMDGLVKWCNRRYELLLAALDTA